MLTDTEARKIASDWHGGGGSALYVLASTGAISNETVDEINDTLKSTLYDADELFDLRDYCHYHNIRGPQDGWGKLTW